MEKMTLEQILRREKARRHENGASGINACKECIKFDVNFFKKSLYQFLEEYVKQANSDMFFNKSMVLACYELINEK